jgi:hypothetical protein
VSGLQALACSPDNTPTFDITDSLITIDLAISTPEYYLTLLMTAGKCNSLQHVCLESGFLT